MDSDAELEDVLEYDPRLVLEKLPPSKSALHFFTSEVQVLLEDLRDQIEPMLSARLRESRNITHPTKQLHHHQHVGVAWMLARMDLAHLRGLQLGSLLADAMGVGKMIQTIWTIRALRLRSQNVRVVICPAAVRELWLKEFQEWAPELCVIEAVRFRNQISLHFYT